MTTKIEFAVQMTCEGCADAVKKSLEGVSGIKNVNVNLQTGSVVVDTTLTTDEVQKQLEKSGKKVVVRGYAGSSAGVSILDTGCHNIKGVVRFIQIDPNTCVIDGTIDGLNPGKHGLFIHETGDLSNGCESTGNCFNPKVELNNGDGRCYGNLGLISATNDGRAAFRLKDEIVKLSDIIGRSLVVTDEKMNKREVCGIIARSAGLFQNPKTICACDGVSIWDETNKAKSLL